MRVAVVSIIVYPFADLSAIDFLILQQQENSRTERIEGLLQVVLADEPIMVVINQIKGLLEFRNLLLVKHREDVRRGALGSLLLRLAARLHFRAISGYDLVSVL